MKSNKRWYLKHNILAVFLHIPERFVLRRFTPFMMQFFLSSFSYIFFPKHPTIPPLPPRIRVFQGYILSNSIISPPPFFEIIFFPRRTSLRRAGRSPDRRQGGWEDPPAKIFGIYDPHRCILRPFPPLFM